MRNGAYKIEAHTFPTTILAVATDCGSDYSDAI